MSGRVILRRAVPDDLHAIVAWLEQYSDATADRFVKNFYDALDGLAEMPGKGSPKQFRSRRLRNIRSWWVPGFRNYLIFYQPIPSGIDVLAVTHGSRQLRKLLLTRA